MIFQSSGLMIPSLQSIERVHPGVKLSMNHPLNTGRRRAEPSCHGIGIEVPGTDLTLPNSGKGDKQSHKQTKRPNVELSISSIGFRLILFSSWNYCLMKFHEIFQGDRKSKVINNPRLSKLIGPVCHGIKTPDHLPATNRIIRRPLVLPALRDKLL